MRSGGASESEAELQEGREGGRGQQLLGSQRLDGSSRQQSAALGSARGSFIGSLVEKTY